MKSIVRSTTRYDEEAKQYGCTKVLVRYKARVERTPGFAHFARDEYGFDAYVKKEHSNFRTIFTYRNHKINGEDIRCYLALRVFKRGDAEYEVFQLQTTSKSRRNTITGLTSVNWDQIWREVEDELSTCPQPEPLPELTGAETSFISRENGITQEIFDIPIYESKQWVETVRRDDFGDPFKVAEAIEKKIYEVVGDDNEYGLIEIPYGYGDKGEKILCYRLKESESKDGWFLLGLGTEESLVPLREEIEREISSRPETIKEMLTGRCRRAYPLSMFDDKDFWAGMEKDKGFLEKLVLVF